jgi:acetyl-CoA acetyltransferase
VTAFGKHVERSAASLAQEAVIAALQDTGIIPRQLDAVFLGSVYQTLGAGQRLLKDIGVVGMPIVNVENACASSTTAVIEATAWIRAGMADVALCVGVEQLSDGPGATPELADPVSAMGANWPVMYAIKTRAKMERDGLTAEQIAMVSVKNRRHAMENPKAHLRSPLSIDDVLGSRPVADPLTVFECCPPSDGAAAVVLLSPAGARRLGGAARRVRIRGVGLTSGRLTDGAVEIVPDVTARTARAVYEQSGLGPDDLQLCEVHDAFAPAEIFHYESLGLCAQGEGGKYVESGHADIGGGGVAVNPGGGLLSRGHPLGATGIAQICEVADQLRGRCGGRQVDAARVGLTHAMGGTVYDLESNACAITVLSA